jgi:hypothetical protein
MALKRLKNMFIFLDSRGRIQTQASVREAQVHVPDL